MIQENHSLSEHEIEHFKVFGFILRRKVFTPAEVQLINEEFDKGKAFALHERDDSAFNIRGQMNWSNLGPESPFLASLLEDERICGAAEQLLGNDVIGVSSNCNAFAGDRTEWHPDTGDPNYYGAKFLIYPQFLDENSGALRVIPGSNHTVYSDELRRMGLSGSPHSGESSYLSKSGLEIKDIPCYVCRTEPGDVIIFDYKIWHSTWGGSKDRRMISYNFSKNPKTPEEEKLMSEMVEVDRQIRESLRSPGLQYYPEWVANPERNERRERWIKWLREKGAFEAPQN